MRPPEEIERARELLELVLSGKVSVPNGTPEDRAAWDSAALVLRWCCSAGEEGDDFSVLLYLVERAAERALVLSA